MVQHQNIYTAHVYSLSWTNQFVKHRRTRGIPANEAQIQFIWSERWDARTLHTSEITTSGKCQTDWDKHRGSSEMKKVRKRKARMQQVPSTYTFSSPSPLFVKFHFPFASFSSSAFDSLRCFNLHISPRWWEHLHSVHSTARRIIAQPENENKLADGLFGGFCLDFFRRDETSGVFGETS